MPESTFVTGVTWLTRFSEWNAHKVRTLPSRRAQLFIGLHLIPGHDRGVRHDPPARWKVAFPDAPSRRSIIVPTSSQRRPFLDVMAEEMTVALERNCKSLASSYSADALEQGIVHVIGPQLRLTQPGMTIACGDATRRRMARLARLP